MQRLQKRLLFPDQGMFFPWARESQELENHAVEPVIKETERMVYVAFSEYFFDSAMHAYFQAGVLAIELQGEKVSSAGMRRCWDGAVQGAAPLGLTAAACLLLGGLFSLQVPKDLEVLLRATFFGTIFMLVRGAPSQGGQDGEPPGQGTALSTSASPALLRAPRWTLPCGWCCRRQLPPAASSNPRAPRSPSLPSSTSRWCHRAALPSRSPAWPW